MNASAIICLGNRFVPGDDIGCRVYDCLTSQPDLQDIDIIDGGLCGLDLLRVIEGRQRVVFADAVTVVDGTDNIAVLDHEEVAAYAVNYGHSAGLPYLLHMLPHVCTPPWPEITLAGVDGRADDATIHALAERCMALARQDLR